MINKASLLKHCLSKFTNKKDKKSVEWFIQGLNLESGIESLIESMHKMMPALWKDGKSINAVMYCYNYIKEALPKKYHDQEELFRRNKKRYTNDLDESVQLTLGLFAEDALLNQGKYILEITSYDTLKGKVAKEKNLQYTASTKSLVLSLT